jgi:hypothetical protein
MCDAGLFNSFGRHLWGTQPNDDEIRVLRHRGVHQVRLEFNTRERQEEFSLLMGESIEEYSRRSISSIKALKLSRP